jgi:CHAT domain-containing protein/tetratricopeptide (TPR) repeat protein
MEQHLHSFLPRREAAYKRRSYLNSFLLLLSLRKFSLALLLGIAFLSAQPLGAQTDSSKSLTSPDPNKIVTQVQTSALPELSEMERELEAGETHAYRIILTEGDFFYALVEQNAIDVIVNLYGPDGALLANTDSPNDRWGTEPILLIAGAPGNYRVEVRSADSKVPAGRYVLKIVASRRANEKDKSHVSAQRAFEEGQKLRAQQNATAKRAAIQKYEEALKLFKEVGDIYGQALSLNRIGFTHLQLNQYRASLDYLDESLTLARTLGDKRLEANIETFLGGANDVLGEVSKALDHYERALILARANDNKSTEASALNNIGLIFNDLADWQKALEYYLLALPTFKALGNKRNEAITLNNIGLAYSMLGDQAKALDYLQQSLPLRRASGDKEGEANTLNNIGIAHRRLGKSEEALNYYGQAQKIQQQTGNRAREGDTLDLIGVAYSGLNQPAKALEYHQQAFAIHKATGNLRGEAMSLNNLGDVFILLGQPAKAREQFAAALSILRGIGDLDNAVDALVGHARAEQSMGRLDEARQHLQESLTQIETVRVRAGSQQFRASYLASMGKTYELYISLLMQQHAGSPSHGYDAEALRASERGRARSLVEMLNESHVDIREGVDAALVKKELELKQYLNAKAQRLIQLKAQKGNQQEIAALNKEISALEDEYQQVQVAIRKASPAYAALTQPQPLGLKEIQAQLDRGTMLLEYSLGEERSYVWAVTPTSLKTYELPKREQIEKAARLVYDLLTARSKSIAGENAQQKQARIAQVDSQLSAATMELSQMVLGPIGSELTAERLVVVADGALQYVPFAALSAGSGQSSVEQRSRTNNGLRTTDNEGLTNYRPLIVDHEVISLPSASALAIQREGLRNRKPAPNAVAVIADPVFAVSDERLGLAKTKAAMQASGDGSATTRIIEHLAEDSGLVIRRLKFTRQEADQILAEAPRGKNFRAIDFQANRATATGGELSKYRYVHFATHGYIDSERSDLSAIVLSLVDEQGKPQDGFLRAHEIYNLNLPAELVVLSACETGLGKEIKGEGLVGLTRGFMYAGARRVVVSLWNVNDKATAELMARFYRGMLRENKTPAAALRAAQIEMSRQKQWQSPYYWAPFVLQGEWK